MALAIVQAKAHGNESASGTTCHTTLGAAPTNGNLLWCGLILDTADGAPNPGTGWVVDTSGNLNGVTVASMYKYAGAGESATQQPVLNGEQFWGISMYEISGVSGVWATDHIATHLNPFPWQSSTGNVTSFATANNNEFVIAMFGTGGGASGDNVTVSGTGGAGTRDDSNEGLGTGVSPNIPIFNLCNSWGAVPTAGTTFNQALANVNGQGLFYAILELQSPSSDVIGSGSIGTLTLTPPAGQGQVPATGSGSIGTINFSAPVGTGVISAVGSGPIGTINMTPPTGIGTSSVIATGTLGTIAFKPPFMTFERLTQFTQQALAFTSVNARLTQFGLDTLGKNSVNARATFMSLLVLARGGEPPLQPNPLSLHDGGREPVLRLRFVNMYPEQTPQGPGTEARYQRAGLYSAAQYGGGPIQALQHWVGPDPGTDEFLMTISGGSVYRDNVNIGVIDPFLDPTWFPRGKRIHCARSETQFMACSNGKLYSIDLSSVTQVATTGILPAGIRDIAFLGGRFIYVLNDDSGQFYYSDIGDGTTISGLSLATASEDDPFPLIAAWDLADDVYFFTSETVEIWYVSADPANPYQRSQGRRYNKGLLAQDSVELIDNSLFWLGHDRQIYRSGAIPIRVSNFDVEDRIRRLTDQEVKQCYSFGASIGGHNFYVIHLMSQGTWAYDIPSRTWAEWQSYNKDRFRAFCSDDTFRLFGDYYLGHLMGMDGEQHQDLDGVGGFDPIERVVSAFYPLKKGRHVNFNVILMATRGVGGRVEMRWSDHEGHDWSPWLVANLGATGERGENAKAVWSMLGGMSPPGRLYEFRCTDDCFFAPYQLRVDEERP